VSIAADEQQTSAAITDCEIDRAAAVARNGFHRNVQKLTERLIEVVKTECGTDFGRSKCETQPRSARVDIF
jgi:hypothetical protein